MRIVLLGPPGAGKGSLASLCGTRLQLAHLSTGEIFRREIARRSALGQRVARYVTTGRLAPDRLVGQVMAAQLSRRMLASGFVLDGFPRTEGQAEGLDRELKAHEAPLDGAVYLTSPPSLLVRRLTGRRVCVRCGANYHIRTMRPKRPNRCDRCEGRLTVRRDDQVQTITRRLRIDRQASRPLLRYYGRHQLLYRVNGEGNIETVFARAVKLFRRLGWLNQAPGSRTPRRRPSTRPVASLRAAS